MSSTFESAGTSILVFVPSLFVIVMMITPSMISAAAPPAASSHLRRWPRGGVPCDEGWAKVVVSLCETWRAAGETFGGAFAASEPGRFGESLCVRLSSRRA